MDSILIYQAANDLVQNTGTRNIKRIARSCSLDISETPRFKDVLGFLSLHFDKPLILIKALIFKKSDVEDLREKLQDACDHPEMVMKMKNQAADFICKKYNWDEVVKETMKLYRR